MYEPCKRFKEWAIEKQLNVYKKTFVSIEHDSSRYFNVFIGELTKKYPIKNEAEWVKFCEENKLKDSEVYGHFTEVVEDFVLEAYIKHLTNKFWENDPKVEIVKCINPECLAFKEWAVNNGYWVQFKYDYNDLWILEEFTLDIWMRSCNRHKYTGRDIVLENIPTAKEGYWIQIWNKYIQSQKKSPAKIFIEWALKQPYDKPTCYSSMADWYFRACHGNITKERFIEIYKNSSLDTIYLDGFNSRSITKDWSDYIQINWQKYLNTLNNGNSNQLQRKEIPESEGSGTAGLGSCDRDDCIEPSGCDCNFEKGYEISAEGIDISEADLSFGFDCSL